MLDGRRSATPGPNGVMLPPLPTAGGAYRTHGVYSLRRPRTAEALEDALTVARYCRLCPVESYEMGYSFCRLCGLSGREMGTFS